MLQDDQNAELSAKIKEMELDRGRVQKTTSTQQKQIEKHRALAEESSKKCDGLQLEVSGLKKVCVTANTQCKSRQRLNNKPSNRTPSATARVR